MVAVYASPDEVRPAASAAAAGVSLLGSLVIVARHHGVQLSVPQLIHDHLLEPGQPSVAQLLSIADASGLRATTVRLTWAEILRLGQGLPPLLTVPGGHAVGLRQVHEGTEPPRRLLPDP